jgi:molybdopterin-guanine dinucleotide biosynthesis protein B
LLATLGLTINVVKHSHQDVEQEPPHKDSARFRRASAQEVLLATPYRYAVMREHPAALLADLRARLSPANLTLGVEGYTDTPMPRGLDLPGAIALACDVSPPYCMLPVWPPDQPEQIALLITRQLQQC